MCIIIKLSILQLTAFIRVIKTIMRRARNHIEQESESEYEPIAYHLERDQHLVDIRRKNRKEIFQKKRMFAMLETKEY